MTKIRHFEVKEYCEHDGCFAKPEVIFIYENYPLQLCRGCYDNFDAVLRSNKAWSRRLKDGGKNPEFVIFDDIHDAGIRR